MSSKRLETWGEIAKYLEKGVSTVQRWEKVRGLPVHRLGPPGSSNVYAFTDELDAWFKHHFTDTKEPIQGATATAPETDQAREYEIDASRQVWRKPSWKIALALAGSLVVVALLMITLLMWPSVPRNPVSAAIESGNRLVSRDSSGDAVWTHQLPEGVLFGENHPYNPLWRFQDLDGDQLNEMVFAFRPDLYTADLPQDEVWLFDSTGLIAWKRLLGREISRDDLDFPNHYSLREFGIYDLGSGKQFIVVIANHSPSFPSQVSILDPDGRLIGEYWHPGYLFSHAMLDIDRDGIAEIVLGGINNLEGKAACLLAVDHNGQSTLTPILGGAFRPSFDTREFKKYVLFPRTCVAEALAVDSRAWRVRERAGVLVVEVEINLGEEIQERVYSLDSNLELVRMEFPQSFVSLHRQLERERRLDHVFDEDDPDRCLKKKVD